MFTTVNSRGIYGYQADEDLPPSQRDYDFTFERPVTVMITVTCNDDNFTKRTVWLDFLAKDYYFEGKFSCDHNLCTYPELGFNYDRDIEINFINFVAFYDSSRGKQYVIDYLEPPELEPSEPGPFAMRTVVPAVEERYPCYEDNDVICSIFKNQRGAYYDYEDHYPEVNAIVFGGAFAKFGDPFLVQTDKGKEIETRKGSTERVEPIFCTLLLSDLGEWIEKGVSEPRIVEIQLGNKYQGLVLITDPRFLPVGVIGTTIGSVEEARINYPFNAIPTIEGSLKTARVGFSINLEDSLIMAPVTVDIPEASWRMPYLEDTANLESLCGE